VARVLDRWPLFMARFPDPATAGAAGPAAIITACDRLGYPRRARWLWEAAARVARDGWPSDLAELPGVGRYTAAAIAAQVDDADEIGIEVNIRRVCERTAGRRLTETEADRHARAVGGRLRGRDRLLALMDLGATVCTARDPQCGSCPVAARCATRGVLDGETRSRQAPFAGSFRQRRGNVMAHLRAGPTRAGDLDAEALASLVRDGLAEVSRGRARLPRAPRSSSTARAQSR
jgi:A/G-specific adenine glycosylase